MKCWRHTQKAQRIALSMQHTPKPSCFVGNERHISNTGLPALHGTLPTSQPFSSPPPPSPFSCPLHALAPYTPFACNFLFQKIYLTPFLRSLYNVSSSERPFLTTLSKLVLSSPESQDFRSPYPDLLFSTTLITTMQTELLLTYCLVALTKTSDPWSQGFYIFVFPFFLLYYWT